MTAASREPPSVKIFFRSFLQYSTWKIEFPTCFCVHRRLTEECIFAQQAPAPLNWGVSFPSPAPTSSGWRGGAVLTLALRTFSAPSSFCICVVAFFFRCCLHHTSNFRQLMHLNLTSWTLLVFLIDFVLCGRDFYKILNVPRGATEHQIKKVCRLRIWIMW